MSRRLVLSMWLMLAALGLLTGCGAQWQVVHQTNPSPFVNQRRFAVAPIDYSGLMIGSKPEAEYLSEKDEGQKDSFIEDKKALNEEFAKALISGVREEGITVELATGPASGPFVIRPSVAFIEPGFYAVVASGASEVRMTVRITTPDGRVLDEILVNHGTDSKSGFSIGGISLNPSSGGRLRKDGEGLGEIVANYLKERVGGD
jgi:hypothetical protein